MSAPPEDADGGAALTGVTPLAARRPHIRPTRFNVAVAVLSVWGAAVNLARITFPGTGFDEPLYALAGWRYVHGSTAPVPEGTSSNFDNFEHPPLAKYLFGLADLFVGRPSVGADRVVAAICTLATAVVLGWWLATAAGRWIGLGAGALVVALPMSVAGLPFRFGRYGYLDPVAELFAVGSIALAWTWFRGDGRARWWFALATGGCVGLATSAKETGFLGATGVVLLGLAVGLRRRSGAWLLLAQALAAVLAAVAVFALTYLPLGRLVGPVGFLVRVQRDHARYGHAVDFAGQRSAHPPWWAFLWFAQHGLGIVVTVACLVCVTAALVLRRDALVLWLVAALAGPLVFHMFIAGVVLPYYWVMWMPAFLALVALGVAELTELARSSRRIHRVAGVLLGAACVTVLTAASAHDGYRTVTRPAPAQRSYSAAVLRHSPAAYLRLNETTGSIAADVSGNGHAGAYLGGVRIGSAGLLRGQADRAITVAGVGQHVEIPAGSWADVPNYSLAVWFRATRPNGYLLARDNYVAKVWNLQLDPSGHLRFVTYAWFGGAAQAAVSARSYADGRPHLAVCVKDGTSMRLFVDGQLAASASWPTYARSGTPAIDLGQRGNGASRFVGVLDDFALFDAVLSGEEALALFREGS